MKETEDLKTWAINYLKKAREDPRNTKADKARIDKGIRELETGKKDSEQLSLFNY